MNTIRYAYDVVKERLQSGAWGPGRRLPSLAELATLCGVSRTTMWKAVGLLNRDRVIHVRGKAIIAGSTDVPLLGPQNSGFASNRLRREIGKAIFSGAFPKDGLPPLDKAALQYGVAINTLKKALEMLVEEGLLVKRGRRYHSVPGWLRQHQQEMVLISEGESSQSLSINIWRTEQVVIDFERECLRLGYVPRCLGFNRRDAKGLVDLSKSIRSMHDVAGFIVNLFNPWSTTQWQRWLDMLGMLVARAIPVIVIDQEGDLTFPDSLTRSRNFRALQISGVRAGEMVAAALLKRGHERISYVTPFYKLTWAQKRYEGLVRYYRHYGVKASNVELCAFTEITQDCLTFSILGLATDEIESLFKERYSREQLRDVRENADLGRKLNLPGKLRSLHGADTIRETARFLVGLIGKNHSASAYDYLLESLVHIASNTARQWHLNSLLEKALEHNDSSAWVCSDIATALAATLLLQSRGKRIPKEISVIGFENVHESQEYQLSTYDFNMHGMVQQALLLIVDEKTLKATPPLSEVDGYVVERRTTTNYRAPGRALVPASRK